MIKLCFFGRFSDCVDGAEGIKLSSQGMASLEDIYQYLSEKHPELYREINTPQVMVAVNQQIVSTGAKVAAGDEVAFLPPVTGG